MFPLFDFVIAKSEGSLESSVDLLLTRYFSRPGCVICFHRCFDLQLPMLFASLLFKFPVYLL
jgi:hypothetical protein